MKYKRFKYKSYSKQTVSKRKVIIIIAIVLAALLAIAAAVIGIVALVNKNNEEKLAEENKQIVNIQISRAPDKISYFCGEIFDATGLTVYYGTKGGDFAKAALENCTITGFDSSAPAESQTITVTYKGFTDTFVVEIKEPIPEIPVLESISMETLPKTEYKKGEGYNGEGGVILCTYTDGTTKTIELQNEYVSGFRVAYLGGPGEYDITVKYSENGIQATTTYKITISE